MDSSVNLYELNKLIGKRIQVPTMGADGWIETLDIMPHPLTNVSVDMAVVNAARVSFLGESKGLEADKNLLLYLFRNKHTSPFEMAVFKFRVRAPLVTWWQWARHRMASYNAQSGRYTEFDEDAFYIPEASDWRKQSKSNKQASSDEVLQPEEQSEIMSNLYHIYGDVEPYDLANDESWTVSDLLSWYAKTGYTIYKTLVNAGVAREQARLFLPGFSVYYTWIVKMDLHNLLHFLRLRMDRNAQHEIRVYANAIYDVVKQAAPWTAEAFEKYSE